MSDLERTAETEEILRLTLNRPEKLNALDPALLRDIAAAIREASGTYRVVIVDGAGEAFTAGVDLEAIDPGEDPVDLFQDLTRAVLEFEGIVIGQLHGWVVGGGFEWTLAFDLRYAAESATFKCPESEIGVPISNASSLLLPMTVGLGRARELLYTAREVDAGEAAEMGLVSDVVPEDTLHDRVMETATDLVEAKSERGLRLNKRAVTRALQVEDALQDEALVGDLAMAEFGGTLD
jgi:2-(1,2-epoxy-1,2-dihydrophenyl)acetyl-CoA isomerase